MSSSYQQLSEREHVLVRPDMYIGSVELIPETTGIPLLSTLGETDATLSFDTPIPRYSSAVMQLIDEIFQNAVDEAKRGNSKHIEVSIKEGNVICIENDGPGIPVQPFSSTNAMWTPTVLFSEFRSGSNFVDNGARITAGKNGIGSKATNIFSQWFRVETVCPESKKFFQQTFRNNMSIAEAPVVKSSARKNGYVKIEFLLDWEKLHFPNVDFLEKQLFARCFFTASSIPTCKVTFQEKVLHPHGMDTVAKAMAYKTFRILPKKIEFEKKERVFVIQNDTDTIAFGLTEEPCAYNILGFVNGLVCSKGTHIQHYLGVLQKVLDLPFLLKKCPNFFLVVDATVVEPKFTSQTKDVLASTKFKDVDIPDSVKTHFKSHKAIKDLVKETAERENMKKLAAAQISSGKTLGSNPLSNRRRVTIPKLTDAPLAGTRDPRTTLILCEGDSAMGALKSGLLKEQREYFGIFPLRGKIPNALKKDASVLKNHEIQSIVDALGLRFDNPGEVTHLRYKNGIILATDQDSDGHHICSLVYAFFWRFFKPLLVSRPDFIRRMNTPLIKAVDKKGKVHEFFTPEAFKATEESFASVKYFKGLGTNTIQDMTGYFSRIDAYLKPLFYNGPTSDEIVETFFGNNVDKRKVILQKRRDNFDFGFSPNTIEEYMYRETGMYFLSDIVRSIPCVVDGLKPSLRKIVFAVVSEQPSKESGYKKHGIKVSDFASIVSKYTMYHHGETSMQETVIGMSQCIVGVNNIPLLRGIGNFGTRETKPSDGHASPRYIYVNHFDLVNTMFPREELDLLRRVEEDGQLAECEFFTPTVPFILVNGSEGIGTGWSSSILPRNFQDILRIQKRIVESKSFEIGEYNAPFHFSKFHGDYRSPSVTSLETVGKARYIPERKEIKITELPIGVWTSDFIDSLREKFEIKKDDSGAGKFIVDIFDRSSAYAIDITIVCDDSKLTDENKAHPEVLLGLVSKFNVGNCYAVGVEEWMKNYVNVRDIFVAHGRQKLLVLEKRLEKQRKELAERIDRKSVLLRFLRLVFSGELLIFRQEKRVVEANLMAKEFCEKDFDWLLRTSFASCTLEKISELEKELEDLEVEKEILSKKTVWDIWMEDLGLLEKAFVDFTNEVEEDEKSVERQSAIGEKEKSFSSSSLTGKTKRARKDEKEEAKPRKKKLT